MKRNWTRFAVKYKSKKDKKIRHTQVTADGKLDAARILVSTLAEKVYSAEPMREKNDILS